MSMILGYIKEREISFLFFLLLVLLVIVLWNLYKKEKKREEAAELSVAGERKYYLLNFVTVYLKGSIPQFIEFCDFVLRDFDHRNFAFVSAKFLFYWAKWSV